MDLLRAPAPPWIIRVGLKSGFLCWELGLGSAISKLDCFYFLDVGVLDVLWSTVSWLRGSGFLYAGFGWLETGFGVRVRLVLLDWRDWNECWLYCLIMSN